MSIYCSSFETEPYRYRGSHIMPSRKDDRAGLSIAYPAAHVPTRLEQERGIDYVDAREDGTLGHPWLRLSLWEEAHDSTVVLHERQVRELRDYLDAWLALPKVKRTG